MNLMKGKRVLDIETLKQIPLFAVLSDEQLKILTPEFKPMTVPRGGIILKQGEENHTVYVIIDGKIKVTRNSKDGRESIITIQGPNDLVGTMSVYEPCINFINSVAISKTELVSLDLKIFRDLLASNPKFNEQFIRLLTAKMNLGNEQLSNVVFSDVTGRVAKVLDFLTEKFGSPAAEGTHVRHELTQEELAHYVGSSRETVNKALSDFSTEGWLRLGSRRVLVLDRSKLKQRAERG
ncbi:MAG: Crp/Fnr family transcriptional regulator [Micrococcaceae bacterium]